MSVVRSAPGSRRGDAAWLRRLRAVSLNGRRVATALLAAAVAFGVAVRIVQYAADRSLWFDESLLALNLLHRSALALTRTLDFDQVAPIGFLELEKLVIHLFGSSERVLRLAPLVFGVASVPLFALVARRVLAPFAAVLATLVLACAPGAVYYASEVKQYSGDLAVTIALVLLGLLLCDPRTTRRGRVASALGGAVLIPFSTSSAFVAGGVAVAVGARAAVCRNRGSAESAIAVAAWLASAVGVVVFIALRSSRFDAAIGPAVGLFPHGEGSEGPLHWLAQVASGLWRIAGYPDTAPERYLHWPLVALGLVGAVGLARRMPYVAVMLALPFATMATASALHRYPVFDRTVLFLLPSSVLFVAEGLRLLACAPTAPSARLGVVVAAGVIAVPPLVHAGSNVQDPMRHEEIKSALGFVRSHWRAGDGLAVDDGARYAMRYYLDCGCFDAAEVSGPGLTWRFGSSPAVEGGDPEPLASVPPRFVVADFAAGSVQELRRRLDGLVGRRRVWLLVSHTASRTDTIESRLDDLGRDGRQLERYETVGAAAYLYDLGVRSP